jgi:NADH-quinone oxidoreductase subunit G
MSQDIVNLEVDGKAVTGRKGQMIIHVTDAINAYVPRFCYHDKLSIAANCRMCLVEVEKAPKPLPACATPIMEGMKVFTKSPKAIAAQRATMEFLLINHPLDCPICDQGGECELQDLAVGFGRDAARFNETKRVVKDKDLGPLISTDMTRCIHCTRCVRFTSEVAGEPTLGTIGRGENTQISTFIEMTVNHELSGNIIDLCPVGALNSKPFRYQGRTWEMQSVPFVGVHDVVGSHAYAQVRRGKLMRVVPRDCERLNETWLSDRDRFSYEGIYAADRIEQPLMRQGNELVETSWEAALNAASAALLEHIKKHGADQVGVLVSPNASVEEGWLAQRLARGLNIANIDHRLRRVDCRDQANDPIFFSLGIPVAELSQQTGVVLVGADLRKEAPILAHRVRHAVIKNHAAVASLEPVKRAWNFTLKSQVVTGYDLLSALDRLILAVAQALQLSAPSDVSAQPLTDADHHAAAALLNGERRLLILGAEAERHPSYSDIRAKAAYCATLAKATLGFVSNHANGAGLSLAGVLPHRQAHGVVAPTMGLDAHAMMQSPRKAYVLVGGIEASRDGLGAAGERALAQAELVIALTPFGGEAVAHADVVLPVGTFAESSGSFVNIDGELGTATALANLVGAARPAWKVLRVLGNLCQVPEFDYESTDDVRLAARLTANAFAREGLKGAWTAGSLRPGHVTSLGAFECDAIVRRSVPLQLTNEAKAQQVVYE